MLVRVGRWLKPDLLVRSLPEVPLERLWERGIRALIVDLDNTVAPWNCAQVDDAVREWLARAREQGFALCLTSNNGYRRGAPVAARLGLPLVGNAGKPRRRCFLQAMSLLGSRPEETAVVGDQVFTDVLGGKRLGLLTVLVHPLSPREFVTTRLMRRLERLVMRFWQERPEER